MGNKAVFKAVQLCFSAVLFFGLMACERLDVYVVNQAQDNIEIGGAHIKQGKRALIARMEPGSTTDFDICRSYGCLANVNVHCPENINFDEVTEDTITITEPQYNVFQGAAQVVDLFVTPLAGSSTEYNDMPAEDISEDIQEEPAGEVMGDS